MHACKVSIVSGEILERLKQRLQESQGFHSYGQIQQWLVGEFKLNIAYKTVYELVRYRIGAKLKVPRTRCTKQHPQSLSHFKKKLPRFIQKCLNFDSAQCGRKCDTLKQAKR
ncbi:MAG: hypothetical protein PUP91_21260 [Rhizonema sp. PD37]|nr:hypothetical protein [Rhizonema sp. PD37]